MKKFLKKIFQSNLVIKLRNSLGYKIVKVNLKNLEKNFSISDAFLWRTDDNYKTVVNYTDVLEKFFNLDDSKIYIHIHDNKGKLLKIVENGNPIHINTFTIDKTLLNNHEGYGTFFIFHKNKEYLNVSIRNSCYTGFSKNNNLPSFVHGNLMGASSSINNENDLKIGIVETSMFKNKIYKIQKSFLKYDNVELFITNPTKEIVYFEINKKKYELKIGECIILNFKKIEILTLKSNCFMLRPLAFVYKNQYMDVFHC